eukprot:5042422-Prymnesium_polylepis.1
MASQIVPGPLSELHAESQHQPQRSQRDRAARDDGPDRVPQEVVLARLNLRADQVGLAVEPAVDRHDFVILLLQLVADAALLEVEVQSLRRRELLDLVSQLCPQLVAL